MVLTYRNIYSLSETVVRKNLHDYFWPEQERNKARERLIQENKKDAWICLFGNHGLNLDVTILINQKHYPEWAENITSQNSRTVVSKINFNDKFDFVYDAAFLKLQHLAADAENVRKTIYISKRFGESAHDMWAAQYFNPEGDRTKMNYMLGFKRKSNQADCAIVDNIKQDLQVYSGLEILD